MNSNVKISTKSKMDYISYNDIINAIEDNDKRTLKDLLRTGVEEEFEKAAIFYTLKKSKYIMFATLVKHCQYDCEEFYDTHGNTPLHYAATHPCDWVRLLTLHNIKNNYGHTPLLSFLFSGNDDKYTLRYLLNKNIYNVNISDNNGYTPLDYAIYYNANEKIKKILINAGARRGRPVYSQLMCVPYVI